MKLGEITVFYAVTERSKQTVSRNFFPQLKKKNIQFRNTVYIDIRKTMSFPSREIFSVDELFPSGATPDSRNNLKAC